MENIHTVDALKLCHIKKQKNDENYSNFNNINFKCSK